jgi:hypothetical protein
MDIDDDMPLLIPHFDRLSIPAVLVPDGDAARAAGSAGIHDPIVIPVTLGEDTSIMLGDGFIPNLTATFEPDAGEDRGPDD